jgi:predicted nucleic acid-binding protein
VTGFLLDTNIISELMKSRPDRHVVAWVESMDESVLYLSALTIGEVRKGIDMMEPGNSRRAALQSWLDRDIRARFAGRILSFDENVADRWGQIEAAAKRRRVALPTVDAQMAATALHYNLTLVTRNVGDVEQTGVPVLNPWVVRG